MKQCGNVKLKPRRRRGFEETASLGGPCNLVQPRPNELSTYAGSEWGKDRMQFMYVAPEILPMIYLQLGAGRHRKSTEFFSQPVRLPLRSCTLKLQL